MITSSACSRNIPDKIAYPPEIRWAAIEGASAIRGGLSILAKTRSNGAADAKASWSNPAASKQVTLPSKEFALTFASATSTATASMSLASTGFGQIEAAAIASTAVPHPISATFSPTNPSFARRSNAFRQPSVVP